MNIEQELYNAAVNLIEKRYPKGSGHEHTLTAIHPKKTLAR